MSNVHETSLTTPIGALRLLADEADLVGVYFADQRGAPPAAPQAGPDHAVLARARAQLGEYFAGDRTRFDLPLRARGSPFQERVWAALAGIPYGETRSYAALARAIGSPAAIRAVGAANARNPLSIVVPCHRVVGSDGSLTGYAGGTARKAWLLQRERETVAVRGTSLAAAR